MKKLIIIILLALILAAVIRIIFLLENIHDHSEEISAMLSDPLTEITYD